MKSKSPKQKNLAHSRCLSCTIPSDMPFKFLLNLFPPGISLTINISHQDCVWDLCYNSPQFVSRLFFCLFPYIPPTLYGKWEQTHSKLKILILCQIPQSKVLSLYQISFVFIDISEPCSTDSALKKVWIFTGNLVKEILSKAPSIILWENSWASSQFFLLYNHPLSLSYALCPFFCLLLLKKWQWLKKFSSPLDCRRCLPKNPFQQDFRFLV